MSENWHFFVMDGEEYLVLGHNPKQNDCLCLRIGQLHKNDQPALEDIARSERAQRNPYLLGVLNTEPHEFGNSWWQFVAPWTFFMPLEYLKNRIAQSQYELFAGENFPVETATTENIEEIIFGRIDRVLEV